MADMYAQSLRAFLKPVITYIDDDSVTEVMINGPEEIWIERGGKLERTDASFTPEGLRAAATNIAQFVGRVLNEERPRLDARLADGSRIHVVLPPLSRKGVAISIRKFFQKTIGLEQYIGFKAITPDGADLLAGSVRGKLNMIVAGGTGSGKTTLLNILSSCIPNEDRIVTIEDSAELKLNQDHLLPLESRPPDKHGKGGVAIADLLHSSLRLRPDRIIIGEVRGSEAFDLVQAMNTGHGGTMCTAHANSPVETLRRIESLCLMHEARVPILAIRAQVVAALDMIVCCSRFPDGSRRITHISEVLPLDEHGDYATRDLIVYKQTGVDNDGTVRGHFTTTGNVPGFLPRMKSGGYLSFPEGFFAGVNALGFDERIAARFTDMALPTVPPAPEMTPAPASEIAPAPEPENAPEPEPAPAPEPVPEPAPTAAPPEPAPEPFSPDSTLQGTADTGGPLGPDDATADERIPSTPPSDAVDASRTARGSRVRQSSASDSKPPAPSADFYPTERGAQAPVRTGREAPKSPRPEGRRAPSRPPVDIASGSEPARSTAARMRRSARVANITPLPNRQRPRQGSEPDDSNMQSPPAPKPLPEFDDGDDTDPTGVVPPRIRDK